jgi:hypothetical protein
MHIVIIALVMDFSGLVLAEAVLSYVGIGVDPSDDQLRHHDQQRAHGTGARADGLVVAGGGLRFMFILVLAANLFADAVRDAFDPRAAAEPAEGPRPAPSTFRRRRPRLRRKAVDGISFDIAAGETFALLGESGCGKSVTAQGIMRLLPAARAHSGGRCRFDGENCWPCPRPHARLRGGKMAMIFQEPATSLNPVLTVGQQIGEVLERHLAVAGAAEATRSAWSTAAPGRHRRSGAPPRRIPLPAFRRHEAAGDDRHRAGRRAGTADRRRADDRARRDGSGADSRPAGEPAGRARHGACCSSPTISASSRAWRIASASCTPANWSRWQPRAFFSRPRHPYTQALFAALPDISRRGGR